MCTHVDFMLEYRDDTELVLKGRIGVTKEVLELLKLAQNKHKNEHRKLSMAKIVCNLIIEKYGDLK